MFKHLLGIEGLGKAQIYAILGNAVNFLEVTKRDLKKVPALRGKTVINLFLEASTRTRTSFEIAGKWLSADVINVSGSDSSVVKGETLLDTARTLESMAPDAIVIRHKESGAPHFLATRLKSCGIINAGDGMHEHPTQALLDLLTLMQYYGDRPDGLEKLNIAIVGDVRHSRVARSNIWAHLALGNRITLVGPPTLIPSEFIGNKCFGDRISVKHNLSEGIEGADVVTCLRMQIERQNDFFVPSLEEYSAEYCISEKILSKYAPKSVVMHPGPANRGVEISSDVLDGKRSLVSNQVNSGVAVRMAVLFMSLTGLKEMSE